MTWMRGKFLCGNKVGGEHQRTWSQDAGSEVLRVRRTARARTRRRGNGKRVAATRASAVGAMGVVSVSGVTSRVEP